MCITVLFVIRVTVKRITVYNFTNFSLKAAKLKIRHGHELGQNMNMIALNNNVDLQENLSINVLSITQ